MKTTLDMNIVAQAKAELKAQGSPLTAAAIQMVYNNIIQRSVAVKNDSKWFGRWSR